MDHTAKTDAELVAATLAGDREAYGQLYDRHARRVRAVVAAVSGDWSAVEDMTQECFLRAYRRLDALRDRNRVGAWLAGFARQVARERRRTLHRDRHEFGAATADLAAMDGHSGIFLQEQIEQVMERLARLPENERLAVHSYFFTEQNATQAAAQLDISRSGFYSLLQRALTHLAALPLPLNEKRETTK